MSNKSLERFERLAGRLVRPHRLVNWLRARSERLTRPDAMRSLPLSIDLEPTTHCNLRCQACQRSEGDWPHVDLSIERFERLLDRLPHLEQIKFQGMGEPLLHEQFFQLVRRAAARRILVSSITNGTTLRFAQHRREILESGLAALSVSIDGACPETHARWRAGLDLGPILDGLRHLVKMRGSARRPRLEIWCVGNRENIRELAALVDLAADLGVDQLTFQTDMTAWGKRQWLDRIAPLRLDTEAAEATRRFSEAHERARQRAVALAIYTGNRFTPQRPCFWPWESCFISAGGLLTRCCILSDPRVHHFGNIDETDFAEIWNSPSYQELRRAVRENRIPDLCRPCYGLAG